MKSVGKSLSPRLGFCRADAREISYDSFMGLAVVSAMPLAVAAALLCAPLKAQPRPSVSNPKRLIEKADRLAASLPDINPGGHDENVILVSGSV